MSIFEFFFKYKPIIYQKGHLAFQLLGSRWLFILFVAAAVVGAYFAYRKVAQDKYSLGLVAPDRVAAGELSRRRHRQLREHEDQG
jgi:hypothetical protein